METIVFIYIVIFYNTGIFHRADPDTQFRWSD